MNAPSHIALGKLFIEAYLPGIDGAYQFAFLLGSIEPDYNPVTYLRGYRTVAHFRGHHFEASAPAIKALIDRLSRSQASFWSYYCLGKLAHYMTDAFTWPHNMAFTGTMQEHMAYERTLNLRLLEKYHAGDLPCSVPAISPATLYDTFLAAHDAYLAGERTMDADMAYAAKTVGYAVKALGAALARNVAVMAVRPSVSD